MNIDWKNKTRNRNREAYTTTYITHIVDPLYEKPTDTSHLKSSSQDYQAAHVYIWNTENT